MDASTITSSTFTLLKQGSSASLPAAVRYQGATKTAVLDPNTDLEPCATYIATIEGGNEGVKDLSGRALEANKVWSFTTSTDITSPLVQPPGHDLILTSTIGSSVPVKVSYSATDDRSIISSYQLEQSTNGGAYADVLLSPATSTTTTRNLYSGLDYRFRVRATDRAHNRSGWVFGKGFTVDAQQESSSSVAYNGACTQESSTSSHGGALRYAGNAKSSARFAFAGTDVAWISPRGPNRGRAEVWLDGAKAATVGLYASRPLARKVVYSTGGLDPTVNHTLEVRVLGTKQAASSGTRVDVDAFVVLR
jgi:Bacterial Ig-like domain